MTTTLLHTPFQLGYVTNDLEAAITQMHQQLGVGEFIKLPDFDEGPAIAIAYAGDMMIELIEPRTPHDGLYSAWIEGASPATIRLHHVGILADSPESLAKIREGHVAQGHAIAAEGEQPGFVGFLYVDTTAKLGHYLEYVYPDKGAQDLFASVPGSTFRTA